MRSRYNEERIDAAMAFLKQLNLSVKSQIS